MLCHVHFLELAQMETYIFVVWRHPSWFLWTRDVLLSTKVPELSIKYLHSKPRFRLFSKESFQKIFTFLGKFELLIDLEIRIFDRFVEFVEILWEERRKSCDHLMKNRADLGTKYPRHQKSTALLQSCCIRISGAVYYGIPEIEKTFSWPLFIFFDRPKSVSLTYPFLSSMIFSGLRSR